jgi:hypothetical protein
MRLKPRFSHPVGCHRLLPLTIAPLSRIFSTVSRIKSIGAESRFIAVAGSPGLLTYFAIA